jgi:hypothetical protein
VSGPLDAFLGQVFSDCVNGGSGEWTHAHRRDDPLRLAEWRTILEQAEKRAAPPCPDCEGSGRVAVHVCRDERECSRKCPVEEQCVACQGEGKRRA